uniref:DNA polymerase alpha subunit B n=1 Tax=Strongyloides venezuelensis TaxID=75913 RepID=A0A0K0FNV9_STRVS
MDGQDYDEFNDIENEFLGLPQNTKPKVLRENKSFPLDDYDMEVDNMFPSGNFVPASSLLTPGRTVYSAIKTPRSSIRYGSETRNLLEHHGRKYKRGTIELRTPSSLTIEKSKEIDDYMVGNDKIVDTITSDYEYYEKVLEHVYKKGDKGDGEVICGQISVNVDEYGKINDKCASLCTPDEIIPLDFDGMTKVSLFCGKRAVYRGVRESNKFRVLEELKLPSIEHAKYEGSKNDGEKSFVVHVAAGPYSLPESCDFSPLYSLIDVSMKCNVSALILIGPFVKVKQFYDKDIDHESYLADLFTQIYSHISGSNMRIIVVPNVEDDACVFPVYPTPRLDLDELLVGSLSDKITFLPDPSTFTLNGVKFSITGIDTLLHISKSDYYRNENSENENRVDRLTSHILEQQTFYPIYPPLEDLPFLGKPTSFEMIRIKEIPHVLLMSSMLPQSYRDLSECLCVNVGKTLRNGFSKLSFNLADASVGATNISDYVKGEFFELKAPDSSD